MHGRIDDHSGVSPGKARRLVDTRALGVAVSVSVGAGAGLAGLAALPAQALANPSSYYCHYNEGKPPNYCKTRTQRKYSYDGAAVSGFAAGYDPCVSYVNSLGTQYGPYCAVSEHHTGWTSSDPSPYRNKTDYCFHLTGGTIYLSCIADYP